MWTMRLNVVVCCVLREQCLLAQRRLLFVSAPGRGSASLTDLPSIVAGMLIQFEGGGAVPVTRVGLRRDDQ